MKDLIILGAGDFGREVTWLVERINQQAATWNLLGFVDDNAAKMPSVIDGYPVLGPMAYLQTLTNEAYVVCSVGTGRVRKRIMDTVLTQKNLHPATLIDPAVIVGRNVRIGEGCVVCAGTILAISSVLSDHVIINLNCTLGHDSVLESYCTVHPGSNLSGKVRVGACTDIGTGTKVIQGTTIHPNCIIGAGAVVVRDLTEPGTYVGVPAVRIK